MRVTDLSLLADSFRPRVERFLWLAKNELGIDVRVAETFRSRADQAIDVASGASKNPIGKHEFGRAIDINIFLNGVYQTDDSSGLYLRCGLLGMALGFRWGGNWDRDKNIAEPGESDFGHFEDETVTIAQLMVATLPRIG